MPAPWLLASLALLAQDAPSAPGPVPSSGSELLGLYTRFRWIVRPGSDLYLVYGHDWRNSATDLLTLNRSATTKLTHTHRF